VGIPLRRLVDQTGRGGYTQSIRNVPGLPWYFVQQIAYTCVQPDAVNARASGPQTESRRTAPNRFQTDPTVEAPVFLLRMGHRVTRN
jgi:hypothetical protein